MRDAAAAAAMSDPERNRWFRRRWVEPNLAPIPVDAASKPERLDFELIGTELLIAWRRECACREPHR